MSGNIHSPGRGILNHNRAEKVRQAQASNKSVCVHFSLRLTRCNATDCPSARPCDFSAVMACHLEPELKEDALCQGISSQ